QVDVGLLHLLEELPGVGRERLDVPTLSLGVNRVEGQRRLARSGQAGNDDQPIPGDIDVDVLEVMDARAAYRYPVMAHDLLARIPGQLEPMIVTRLERESPLQHESQIPNPKSRPLASYRR